MNTRLVAFAVAILLALVGQSFWTRDANLLDGTLLMVLAAAISLWAVGGTRSSEGQPEPVSPAPIRPRGRLYQGVLAVALALFTSGGMVLYIWGTRGAYQAGFLWVISLFLLFFGLYHMEGWPRPHLSRRTLWREGVPLAAILALAAFLRFYRLDTAPPGSLSDEGLVAGMVTLLARGLEGPIHSPFETAWIHVNLPYYPMALAFKLMGSTILASRTVSALVGLGSVAAFYFLARHMFGVTPALGATLLLAMSRWHFHMSRLGWENVIHVVLFETLAFLFLLRGLRSGRPTEYAWAGASTALTVYMYHSGKLLLLMMGVFLLYLLVVERRALYPALRWGLAAYLLGAVMAFAPLGTVIAKDPNRYISHVTEVSLWRQAANNGQDLGVLIRDNALAAVQIFNHRGDLAVRHNIPGAPAFDTLTAALFFLGLVWGVRQARTREGFLLLSWLAIALSAAVMSDNNASMSRAMGAIPPAFLLVAGYARRIQQALPSGAGQGLPLAPAWTRQAVGVGAVAFFGISGLLNYDAYFNQYVKRDDTWREFQNIEWGAARAINQLSWDNDVLVGFEFVDSQVVRYAVLAGKGAYRQVTPADFPYTSPATKGLAYVLAAGDATEKELLRHYYPGGELRESSTPWGQPTFYTYLVSREEAESRQGLAGYFYASPGGAPTISQLRQTVDFGPNAAWPVAGLAAADWQGGLYVPASGSYRFRLQGRGTASLEIDGRTALALDDDKSGTEAGLMLYQGMHRLAVRFTAPPSGAPALVLRWAPPGKGLEAVPEQYLTAAPPPADRGLAAAYFDGPDWQGGPVFRRVDPTVSFWWPQEEPLGQRSFSTQWDGWLDVDRPGEYRFDLFSYDGSWLYIDDQLVVDNGGRHGEEWRVGQVLLPAGPHRIRVRYFQVRGAENFGPKGVKALWSPPGLPRQVIPMSALRPTEGK